MIFGAHIIIYSKNAEADRAFLQDVMGFPSVDAGGGWLILGMPPSEVAVHPAEANDRHELFLMCEDLKQEMANLEARGVRCSSVQEARWGSICNISLPGGGKIGLYQPKHAMVIAKPSGSTLRD